MRSFWLAMLLCVGLALPVHAATVFSEDYEVGTLAALTARDWNIINPCIVYCTTQLVSTTRMGFSPHGGSKMLLQEYRGVHTAFQDANNSGIDRTFSGKQEIWVRYYMRYEAVDPAQPSGFSSITAKTHYFKSNTCVQFLTIHFFGRRQMDMGSNCLVQFPDQNIYHNMNLKPVQIGSIDGLWHCSEYHIKLDTAGANDGILEMWLDGSQTHGFYNVNYTSAAAGNDNTRLTSLQIYRQGSDNLLRYEDDMVMSDSARVGCTGTPAQDTTNPNPPTNLTVQ